LNLTIESNLEFNLAKKSFSNSDESDIIIVVQNAYTVKKYLEYASYPLQAQDFKKRQGII